MELRQMREYHPTLSLSRYLLSNLTSLTRNFQLEGTLISTEHDQFLSGVSITGRLLVGVHYSYHAAEGLRSLDSQQINSSSTASLLWLS